MIPKHGLTPKTEDKTADGKAKAEEKPCVDPDTILLIESFVGITFEAFKVVIACLLSLFVPQQCPADPSNPDPVFQVGHECTVSEAVANLDGFALLVFIWNFITLGVFVVHYVLVYRREAWMVEFLDENDEFGDNNLLLNDNAHLKPYPGVDADLRVVNYRVLITSIVGCVALTVNVIVSGIQIFRDRYASGSFRSATTYITNVLLIVTILKTTISNAYAGIQHHLALSCIHFEPVSYNVIDRDHEACCKNPNHKSAMEDCPRIGAVEVKRRATAAEAAKHPEAHTAVPASPVPTSAPASPSNTGQSPLLTNAAPSAAQPAADMKIDSGKALELQSVAVHVPPKQ